MLFNIALVNALSSSFSFLPKSHDATVPALTPVATAVTPYPPMAALCSVAKTPVARPAAIRPIFFRFFRIESVAVGSGLGCVVVDWAV